MTDQLLPSEIGTAGGTWVGDGPDPEQSPHGNNPMLPADKQPAPPNHPATINDQIRAACVTDLQFYATHHHDGAGNVLPGKVTENLGPNHGFDVDKFIKDSGGVIGEPWCADLATDLININAKKLGVVSPVPHIRSTITLVDWAKQHGKLQPEGTPPVAGDLMVIARGNIHHVETAINGSGGTIGGNTGESVEHDSQDPGSCYIIHY